MALGLFKPIHVRHQVLLWHPDQPLLASIPGERGPTVPSFVAEEKHPSDIHHVTAFVAERLGVAAHGLECLGNQPHPGGGPPDRPYVLEAEAQALSGDARWLPPAALSGTPELADRASAWARAREQAPEGGQGWVQRGAFAEAAAWISRALREAGFGAVRKLEQVRVWEFSSVLRVHAERGTCYFKALPAAYASEPIAVEHLHRHDPARVPCVLAFDLERRWLLLQAVEGPVLESLTGDPRPWEAAASAYSQLQREWLGRPELAQLKLQRLTLARFSEDLEAALTDRAALTVETPEALTPAQLDALSRQVEPLRADAAELAAFGLPETLEHGDLWPSNIFVGAHGPVFIDWTDAAAAHPFLGAWLLLEGPPIRDALEKTPGARERVREAARAAWAGVLPPRELARAFTLAMKLAPAFLAWRMHRELLPRLATPEIAELFPFLMRKALENLGVSEAGQK